MHRLMARRHPVGRLEQPLRLAVVVLMVLVGLIGLDGSEAAAADGCPAPVRTVLDATPATDAATVALTFDDGPSPKWTPQVLDILRRRGVRATFFLVGNNVDAYPGLARQIVAEGHVIGNHTYTHPNLDGLSYAAQAAEIDRGTDAIIAATGVRPCVFRGPYRTHHSSSVKDIAWSRGMNIAGWTHDTKDYTTPLSLSYSFQRSIVDRATSPVHANPDVLMHDGSPGNFRQNTVDAVDRIVTSYASRGYAFTDPAGQLIQPTAIHTRYAQLGGPTSLLGLPVTDEQVTPDGTGAYTHYQRGSIYWVPFAGAREVRGAIRDTWAGLGWERSALGYPTTDELGTPDGRGRYNDFEDGSVYSTPTTGAREVLGAIRDRWRQAGAQASPLGYPTSDQWVTADGVGRTNSFENGAAYWTPTTGAILLHGPVHAAWVAGGAEAVALGYPVRDTYPVTEGQATDFEHGTITWNATTGETTVVGETEVSAYQR